MHALIGLVDKSVVLRSDGSATGSGADADEGAGGSLRVKRYRLLGTLRDFGAAQLTATGERERCLDRLTGHYLAMATRFDEHVLDGEQTDRLRRLRAEHTNIAAALTHSLDDGCDGRPRRPA